MTSLHGYSFPLLLDETSVNCTRRNDLDYLPQWLAVTGRREMTGWTELLLAPPYRLGLPTLPYTVLLAIQ